MKGVVTAEPVVALEVERKCVRAGRGDETTDGQECRNPAANEQRNAVSPPCPTLTRALAGRGPPECRYRASQPVSSRRARQDAFDAPPKIEPRGDGSCDLFYLALRVAAAAHEVERAGHEYCENDENHVEHRIPFVGRRVGLSFWI